MSASGRSVLASVTALLVACGPAGLVPPGGTDDLSSAACTQGAWRCAGSDLETCADGVFAVDETCADVCDPSLGCVVCVPDSATCSRDGGSSRYCLPDGSGYAEETCDPVQGVTCSEQTGRCAGPCAPENLASSYIGCDYFPTVTGNAVGSAMSFAVAIANTTRATATVTIEGGALGSPVVVDVPAGSVSVQKLPWVEALKLCPLSSTDTCAAPSAYGALVPKGAYHLRSTRPVTVYQFNPLEYTTGAQFSFTNDASLLLPTNAWTGNYVVAAYQRTEFAAGMTAPSLLTVTAFQDDTHVTIAAAADTVADGGAPAFAFGVPQTVTLHAGDVIELASSNNRGGLHSEDLTGSLVAADRPVQVIGGAFCAFVPNESVGYCDHLEESMFPLESLSTRYLVTAPAVPRLPNGKVQVVRIIATQRDTTLTFDPPQSAPTTIALPGQFVELIGNNTDFLVTADHKVLVAQIMEGQVAGGNTGDPAMTLAVPVDQYRREYLFHAPVNYDTNYVNVTAATGSVVKLDGVAVTGFVPIGQSGFSVARVRLEDAVDGNHTISGGAGFGITVYGYGQYTSYGYPGGLDLTWIPRL